MYLQGNVVVGGEVKIKITPVTHVDIPEWMQKLSSMVSTVYLSSVKIGKEYSKKSAGTICSRTQLVTKDGRFVSCVGYKDWRQNSVAWRRLLHVRFDPNDTIEEALARLGEGAKDVAYICEESVINYGETHFSFFPIEKV